MPGFGWLKQSYAISLYSGGNIVQIKFCKSPVIWLLEGVYLNMCVHFCVCAEAVVQVVLVL